MWKENRFGWPLRGIICFTLAIAGSCALSALLAGYVQKARSLEKVSHRVEAVAFGLNHCPLLASSQVPFLIATPTLNFMTDRDSNESMSCPFFAGCRMEVYEHG